MLSPVTSSLIDMPTIPGLDDCNDQAGGKQKQSKPSAQPIHLSGYYSHHSPRQVFTANQENDLNASQLLSPAFNSSFGSVKVSHANAPSTPTLSLLCSPLIISATTGLCTPISSTGRVRFSFGDEQRSQAP